MDSVENLLLSDFTLAEYIYTVGSVGFVKLDAIRSCAKYQRGIERALSRLVIAGYLERRDKSYRPTELLLSSVADQSKIN